MSADVIAEPAAKVTASRRNELTAPGPFPIDAAATLAEMLRLRAWLTRLANCQPASTAEEAYARRIRYMARRALQGDPA